MTKIFLARTPNLPRISLKMYSSKILYSFIMLSVMTTAGPLAFAAPQDQLFNDADLTLRQPTAAANDGSGDYISYSSLSRYVGELQDTNHGVSGRVSIRDRDTLVIDSFTYNNRGAAVYIHVATRGHSLAEFAANKVIVPYPTGSKRQPIERVYAGETLIVDLKQIGVEASQVKYLTVWCTIINQSFGYILF